MGRPSAGPLLLLLLAAALSMRLRWAGPADVADLVPVPDAVQYETGAVNLASGRGYVLDLDGEVYPPRYPPGLSLLMALGAPLTGVRPGFGIRAVQWLSAAGLAVASLLAWRAAGPWAGAAAAAILGTSFTHVEYSWKEMADVPSAGLIGLVGAWALSAFGRRSSHVEAFAIGLAAGAVALVRTSNVVLLPPLLLVSLAEPERRRDLRWLVGLCTGIALGLVLVPLDQWWRFGSPFEDGYTFWVAKGFRTASLSPTWYFAPTRHPTVGGPGNLRRYVAAFAGDGTLWSWPVGMLLFAGLAACLRSRDERRLRLGRFTAALLATVVAFFGAYYWQHVRFLLPASAFAAAVAGVPVGLDAPRWARPIALALLALGVALSLAPFGSRLEAGHLFRRAAFSRVFAAVDRVAGHDAVVFAQGDPFIVDRLLRMPAHDRPPTESLDRRFVALGPSWLDLDLRPRPGRGALEKPEIRPQARKDSTGWRIGELERREDHAATADRIGEALDSGRPVVFVDPVASGHSWIRLQDGGPAPEFAGFEFRPVARTPDAVVHAVTRRAG